MKLYVLRHGQAVEAEEWDGPDAARPLTAKGRGKMKREAETIAALGLALDAILTSPLVRAAQTAEIVADALDLRGRLVVDRRLDTGFELGRLGEIVAEHRAAEALMFVGHEPSLSVTVGALIGGGRMVFKKGGLACVELPGPAARSGMLLWLLPPKILARAAV